MPECDMDKSTSIFEYYVYQATVLKEVASLFRESHKSSDPLERGRLTSLIYKKLEEVGL